MHPVPQVLSWIHVRGSDGPGSAASPPSPSRNWHPPAKRGQASTGRREPGTHCSRFSANSHHGAAGTGPPSWSLFQTLRGHLKPWYPRGGSEGWVYRRSSCLFREIHIIKYELFPEISYVCDREKSPPLIFHQHLISQHQEHISDLVSVAWWDLSNISWYSINILNVPPVLAFENLSLQINRWNPALTDIFWSCYLQSQSLSSHSLFTFTGIKFFVFCCCLPI